MSVRTGGNDEALGLQGVHYTPDSGAGSPLAPRSGQRLRPALLVLRGISGIAVGASDNLHAVDVPPIFVTFCSHARLRILHPVRCAKKITPDLSSRR